MKRMSILNRGQRRMAKGNYISNWEADYENLKTTYSEKISSPSSLANYVQYKNVYEHILRYSSKKSLSKIIEVGCGGARSALFLAKQGMDVTCSDFAPEALRLAKDNFRVNGAEGRFVQDDLLNSKLEKEAYDCVMSFGLLEHFVDVEPVMKSMTNLLAPGGLQIHTIIPKKFSTQVLADVVWYPFRFFKRLLKGQFEGIFTKSFRDFPHYENSYDASRYCDFLRRHGHEILHCEATGSLYPFISLPLGLGSLLVRSARKPLLHVFSSVDIGTSRFAHFISPCYYIVARKL